MQDREIKIGGRYAYYIPPTEYIVDGIIFNATSEEENDSLEKFVLYTQQVAGIYPIGTRYIREVGDFLGKIEHNGIIMNKFELVSSDNIEIVELTPDDWQILRDLKIKSMQQEPLAFEDFEGGMKRYLERTEDRWRVKLDEKASNTLAVFAKDGEKYIGMVTAVLDQQNKKALVEHMYVDSDGYRGRGVGKKLLVSLIERLKQTPGIEKAELAVLETQGPAKALYESLGFVTVRDIRATRSGKEYVEHEMELVL